MLAEVIINNIHVDLSDDFSITVEKNSRLTQFEEIVDAWAYNISFPRTEKNEAAFEHAERFQKRWEGWQEYSFVFYYNGRLILNGKIKAKYRGGKYEGYAYGTFGTIAAGYAGKEVKEVLNVDDLTFINKAEYQPAEPYCLFPVMNPGFYDGRGLEAEVKDQDGNTVTIETRAAQFIQKELGKQNRFNSNTNSFVQPVGQANKLAVISPFLFCSYLYRSLMESLDVVVRESVFETDPLLQRACFYTSYDISEINLLESEVVEIRNMGLALYVFFTSKYYTERNYYRYVPASFSPAKLLPDEWTVKDYLLGIQNMLNVIFDFSAITNEVRIRDREAIFSGAARDLNDKLAEMPELEPDEERKLIIDFAKDDNDEIWRDFYTDIDDRKWEDYKGEAATTSGLANLTDMEIGDFYFVLDENQYREYRTEEIDIGPDEKEEVTDWYPLSIYGHPQTVGRGSEEIKIESKFGVVSGWPNESGNMKLPGNSDWFADNVYKFVPRVMFYQGLVNGEPRGDALGGLLDMQWKLLTSTNDLYSVRWQNTAEAIQRGVPGMARFNFDEADFQALDLNEKHRIDQGEFIIEKCNTTFFANHMGVTEAQILKLT